MEIKAELREMLDNLLHPAFFVHKGLVCYANQAAALRQVSIGAPIEPLISTGQQEYVAFSSGRLSLTLSINGIQHLASIVKYESMDLFYLESDYEDAELRAFALVSQSLREPLAEAMSMISSIKQINAGTNTELDQKIQNATRNMHQFHRTLCNMADVSRYSQSRVSRTEYRNIVGIIDEVMNKAQVTISPHSHILEYTGIPNAILGFVDSEKLERSVLNLLSNAFKYSPKGSTVSATLRKNNNTLYFSVANVLSNTTDSPDSNLFMRYLREPGFDSHNTGIGLGIAMIRKAASAHGGTLLFEQPDDNHICFTMSIPIKSKSGSQVQSPVVLPMDYAGGFDHLLVELSDILPADAFK